MMHWETNGLRWIDAVRIERIDYRLHVGIQFSTTGDFVVDWSGEEQSKKGRELPTTTVR